MNLITQAELKQILQISGNTYDSFFANVIPLLQKDLVEYTNNFFNDKIGTHFAPVIFSASEKSISSQYQFLYFRDGCTIYVNNSLKNDGFYLVKTAEDYLLTLDSEETLQDEVVGDDYEVDIYTVKIPQAVKMVMADMVKVFLDEHPAELAKIKTSESIGDYSVAYQSVM